MLELVVNPTSLDFIKQCDFCDGFIVGEEEYSLRLPHYFSFQEIEKIIDLCKTRKQNIYIALNKIIHEEDLKKMNDYLNKLKDYPIDGIIFGDLALYQLAKEHDCVNQLIYNPETYMTNYESVRFFADKGIKRVSVAKEITLKDVEEIASKKHTEIDVLGHGTMNMFHSMRHLVTNYFHFLNKDENHHKEPLYLIEEMRDDEQYPMIEDQHGTHVFSAYDLCTIDYLDRLIENHVSSIRINVFFKSDDVLLQITKIYRNAIDDYKNDKSLYMSQKENYIEQLASIKGIRPFKNGFLFKKTVYKGEDYAKN